MRFQEICQRVALGDVSRLAHAKLLLGNRAGALVLVRLLLLMLRLVKLSIFFAVTRSFGVFIFHCTVRLRDVSLLLIVAFDLHVHMLHLLTHLLHHWLHLQELILLRRNLALGAANLAV